MMTFTSSRASMYDRDLPKPVPPATPVTVPSGLLLLTTLVPTTVPRAATFPTVSSRSLIRTRTRIAFVSFLMW